MQASNGTILEESDKEQSDSGISSTEWQMATKGNSVWKESEGKDEEDDEEEEEELWKIWKEDMKKKKKEAEEKWKKIWKAISSSKSGNKKKMKGSSGCGTSGWDSSSDDENDWIVIDWPPKSGKNKKKKKTKWEWQ